MPSYKYPYIPKEYYAAVMYACKIIRETGNFNRAVRIASSHYDVDDEILERHIRKRQGAGQKGKASPTKNKKYKYFVVAAYNHVDDADGWYVDTTSCPDYLKVEKGISEASVLRRLPRRIFSNNAFCELPIYHIVAERDSKDEAVSLKDEIIETVKKKEIAYEKEKITTWVAKDIAYREVIESIK